MLVEPLRDESAGLCQMLHISPQRFPDREVELGYDKIEFVFCTGHSDIEQPPFLFEII